MIFSKTNLASEVATDITASSAHVNFPASNLKTPFRSKRWRSSGNFVIDATNNKINFREVALGSELTATLTSGSYSPTALALEIKTQMEFVGTNTYTVTFSRTTGLWTITASGGSHFELLNSTGTNQAASCFKVALGFPNADKTGSLTYTGSLIAIHTEETLLFDLKTAQDIRCAVVLWSREDGISLTANAELRLQGNPTNAWTTPAFNEVLTIDENYQVASKFFSVPAEYRYWRLVIKDPRNSDLYVEIGQVWIGESLTFNEPENGFKFSVIDPSVKSSNSYRHEYADIYPQYTQLDFDYSYIEYETAQELENAYRQNGSVKPVLVVFNETESAWVDKDHLLVYGVMEKSFTLDHVSYNLFNGGLKITELG